MENNAAYELYVVVNHVPGYLVAASHPVVAVNGFVAFYAHEVLALCGELAVKRRCSHFYRLVGGEAGCGLPESGEHHGQMLVELILYGVEYIFVVAVNLVPERLALVEGKFLHFYFLALYGLFVGCGGLKDVLADGCYALTELVGCKGLHFRTESFDFVNDGADFLEVALRLVSEYFGDKRVK